MSRSLVKRLQGQLLDATKAFSGRYTLAGLQKLIVQQTRIWHPRILAVLPYRLVRKDQLDFPAFGLEAFRRALRQPVPTELASLSNLLLEQQVFRPPNTPAKKGATSKVIEDRLALYQQAYHRERLEFLGDRVLGLVAASACQLLAPMRPLATADSTPPLAWEQATFTDLASNALAARFARRFDFGARCQDPQMTDRHLADRWEAYLGALYVARGLQAVLEFLAPLLRERVGVLHGSTGTVPPVSLPELERVEDSPQREPEHSASPTSTSTSSRTSPPSTPPTPPIPIVPSPTAITKLSSPPVAEFQPLHYQTMDSALANYIAAFEKRGIRLRRSRMWLKLNVPGRKTVAVYRDANKYRDGDSPLRGLLRKAVKNSFVIVNDPRSTGSAGSNIKNTPRPSSSPSVPSPSSSASSSPESAAASLPSSSSSKPISAASETQSAVDPPTTSLDPKASTLRMEQATSPPALTSFAPLHFTSKTMAKGSFLTELAKHGISFVRDRANNALTLSAPGFEIISVPRSHGGRPITKAFQRAVEIGLIIIDSPDQGKVATSGAAKSSTSSESVASPAEPSLPSPPALPSLPPPTSNTTEPLTTKPTPSLASNTTPEPTPPSDEAILSALTSPPDVDDSPLSSSPPSQPLHDFRPSPALQNPILEALMQKALQDEAAADAKGVIRSGPGGSGGESVDEVKSSLEEEILLFSEVSARRAEAAVGRQRSWVEEELKPNAEEGESKEQTSEKAGKEP